jgi:aminoglycoside phosphotransferase (APT) family kinase protein
MPFLHRYDVEQATLVLDYVAKPNLANHVRRLGRVPKSWMRWLAQFLATLHRSSSGPAESGDLFGLRDHRVPFGLRFDEPDLNLLYMCSDASISLVSILQGCPELSEHLAQLRSIWKPGCLVHGDLRWDNVIVFPGEARRSADPPLRIVDWELAAVGDPCWDIGAVFAAFLGIWLETAPIAGSDPEAYLSLARFPLARTRPALAAFWYAYAERMGLVEHDRREWMLRAVRYSAARVVQTAFEWMQTATSPSPHAVLMLQLADNILCRPHDAAIELLGLDEAHPAA